MISFKEFLEQYWGYGFAQEKDLVNGPAYRERGINSKYKGPGTRNLNRLDTSKMFGFDFIDRAKIDSKKCCKCNK